MLRVVLCCSLLFACGDNLPGAAGDDDVPDGPQCSDGVDNDGDGTSDFPDDLGCEGILDDSEDSPTLPACGDNRDNDGDGRLDFPEDPGCLSEAEDDESDDCPNGPQCPACSNMRDDDINGAMDYPNDPGCESAGDPVEFTENPVACGPNLMISPLPPTGVVMATLDTTSTSSLMTKCGGGGGSSGHAYVMILSQPKIVIASTVDPITTVDTVIDIRRANCSEASAHVVCNDDERVGVQASSLTVSLDAGVYYIIVEGHDSTITGPYQLTVQQFSGEGATCTMQSDCGPGLVCRIPLGEVQMVCAKPVCSDGADDDADGTPDFPGDPGCLSASDNDEADDCPDGPTCPACANGDDDDLDGEADFPADLDCSAASSPIEGCGSEQDPIVAIASPNTTGTLATAHDDHDPVCVGSDGVDVQFTLEVPPMRTLVLDTIGSDTDTVVSLRPTTCDSDLGCDDDGGPDGGESLLLVENLAAGAYVVAVDGFNADDIGAFTLNVTGEITAGGSCENAFFDAGAFICEMGSTCEGAVGMRKCISECSDGIDNNMDGTTDFPNDPGCDSAGDDEETDVVCPGAMCPACFDGADNDGDSLVDFGMDPGCVSASDNTEGCTQSEAVTVITAPATTGTTVGQTNDVVPECAGTVSGPDLAYSITVPALDSLTFQLDNSFDAVIVAHDQTCGPVELACSDEPEEVTLTNVAAGQYNVIVDGFFDTSAGGFTLNTRGVIPRDGSCESPLVAAGVLICAEGLPCTGAVGSRTCSSDCSDGVDNNGDGTADFPNDPGCTSIVDDTEDTVCPGASCPVCADDADNDGDGAEDFPADFGCTSAGGASEVFCAADVDFGGVISAFTTTGTIGAPLVDNFEQSCQGNTGPEITYALQLPVPVTLLEVDTIGSTISDTVLSVKDAACGVELGCDDDGAGLRSLVRLTGVAAGNYAINVDSFSTNTGAFTLHVKGTVAAGTVCTSPLFAGGVLACPTGTTCTGGVCQ